MASELFPGRRSCSQLLARLDGLHHWTRSLPHWTLWIMHFGMLPSLMKHVNWLLTDRAQLQEGREKLPFPLC